MSKRAWIRMHFLIATVCLIVVVVAVLPWSGADNYAVYRAIGGIGSWGAVTAFVASDQLTRVGWRRFWTGIALFTCLHAFILIALFSVAQEVKGFWWAVVISLEIPAVDMIMGRGRR